MQNHTIRLVSTLLVFVAGYSSALGAMPDPDPMMQPPQFTSADNAAFTGLDPATFTVTASGDPTPTLSESGALPPGITFDPATGVLSGTPANDHLDRVYYLIFTAANGVGANAIQNFTLTVHGLTTPLNGSFSGAWYDPAQSGQGIFIYLLPNNQFMAWWFTFAPDGGQAWFGGLGTYAGDIATVTAAQTLGGRFIPNFDPSQITNPTWGTLDFTFDDCNNGRVDFDSVLGFGTGSMTLVRLTPPVDGTACVPID